MSNVNLNSLIEQAIKTELEQYKHINFIYTAENVPNSGKAIYKAWLESEKENKPFPIFNGANDKENLFFTPEINLLYRTLHDVHHAEAYILGRGTTKIQDEKYLNCKMALTVFNNVLRSTNNLSIAMKCFFYMYHDTVGQVIYYAENKEFCTNQKALTEQYCLNCSGLKFLDKGQITLAIQIMQGMVNQCL